MESSSSNIQTNIIMPQNPDGFTIKTVGVCHFVPDHGSIVLGLAPRIDFWVDRDRGNPSPRREPPDHSSTRKMGSPSSKRLRSHTLPFGLPTALMLFVGPKTPHLLDVPRANTLSVTVMFSGAGYGLPG